MRVRNESGSSVYLGGVGVLRTGDEREVPDDHQDARELLEQGVLALLAPTAKPARRARKGD